MWILLSYDLIVTIIKYLFLQLSSLFFNLHFWNLNVFWRPVLGSLIHSNSSLWFSFSSKRDSCPLCCFWVFKSLSMPGSTACLLSQKFLFWGLLSCSPQASTSCSFAYSIMSFIINQWSQKRAKWDRMTSTLETYCLQWVSGMVEDSMVALHPHSTRACVLAPSDWL